MIQLQADLPAGLRTWLIEDTEFTIGRSADCRIQLEHPSVSKLHARVRWQCGVYSLHDLGSANGTWIDGQSLSSIRFDDVVSVVFGTVGCKLQIFDPMFESVDFGRFRVATASVAVGRGAGNDWVIEHPTVSSEHFIVERHGPMVRLINVSRQGTRVGGLPVVETPLAPGDEIMAGNVKIVYLEAPHLVAGAVFEPAVVVGVHAVFRALVSGSLGRDQAASLESYLDAVWSSGARTIELDLSRCSALHPHALDVLITAARKCASSTGGLLLINPAPTVERAVALANATQWLSIARQSR